MTTQASRRLSSLSAEIEAAHTQLSRLRDRLDIQRASLDESRLKMLIAETPLADRDLQAAASAYFALEREERRVEEGLAGLEREQEVLAARLTTSGV